MIDCPQCGRQYEDGMRFCLDDGSPLPVSASNASTAEYRGAPTQDDRETETVIGMHIPTSGPSIVPVLVVVGVVICGIVLLAAAGFAGLWYYASTATDDSTISASTPPVKSTPVPLETLGVSDPIKPESDVYADNKVKTAPRTVDVRKEASSKSDEEILELGDVPSKIPDRGTEPKSVPKQISGGVLNGKATSLPKPSYPPAAQAVRASGRVMVQVLVDESGRVVSAGAVSGHPLLRRAAVSAARRARFSPTKLSGQPVQVRGVIIYNFVAP